MALPKLPQLGSDETGQNMNDPRIIVALDFPEQRKAIEFSRKTTPEQCRLKVGKELFTSAGPALVEALVDSGFDVFLDLKFHDIPNTVARACAAAAGLGVWMLNVHALGGERMLAAAREAVDAAEHSPLLIAVTILTSMADADLAGVGLQGSPEDNVLRLASLAHYCGLDGIVCSSREAGVMRATFDEPFCLVTPGIRPAGSVGDDQRRVMTPSEAVKNGSTYLVIGRPVTAADDPTGVLLTINSELAALS